MNRDDKDFTIIPGVSPEQDSRKDHDHKGRILRTTVTAKLPLLRSRAYDYNDLPLHQRLFFIDGVIAYGSYCNSDREKIGDLDIGILISYHGSEVELFPEEKRRYKSCRIYLDEVEHDPAAYDYGSYEIQELARERYGTDISPSSPYYYAENKVMNYLKNGKNGPKINFLEIHKMDEAIEDAELCGELPYMFFGNFMWIARPNEEKCQEIDRKVEEWRGDTELQEPNHYNNGTSKVAEILQERERSGRPYGHSNQVGKFLKKVMEEKDLDVKGLALTVGASQATVKGWLSGKTTPNINSQLWIKSTLSILGDKAEDFDKAVREQMAEKEKSDAEIYNSWLM